MAHATGWSRRAFLGRAMSATVGTAVLTGLPEVLRIHGWYDTAVAQEPDVVLDTFNGLAAMVWPGDDPYSDAQGQVAERPGAIAANAGRHIMEALDGFVPAPDADGLSSDETVPLSAGVAGGMNSTALSVNPVAAGGALLSPFSRLTFAEKAETWRVLEEETQALDSSSLPEPLTHSAGVLQFVFGVLPGFVQFFAFSEIDVFDDASRTLSQRPVGWDHARYLEGVGTTPPEGSAELIGFYQDRTAVNGSDGTGERFDGEG